MIGQIAILKNIIGHHIYIFNLKEFDWLKPRPRSETSRSEPTGKQPLKPTVGEELMLEV